jgi:hypothetical protein
MSSAPSDLARLLEHPAIWRGTSVAPTETLSTGFGALDARLPGRGWPRSGLIEILVSRFGVGELTLLLPALAAQTRLPMARWCVWVAPPLEPFAPALEAHGVVLERVLVVRVNHSTKSSTPRPVSFQRSVRRSISWGTPVPGTHPRRTPGSSNETLWAFEQSLGSGACAIAMAWAKSPRTKEIRRLQLAAERGRTLGVLFQSRQAARESSHAAVRMAIEPTAHAVRVTLLKSRGGVRGSLELDLQAGHPAKSSPPPSVMSQSSMRSSISRGTPAAGS